MAKKTRPIENLTAVAWECPHCHRGNGIPEVTECVCGAVRVGNRAEAPGVVSEPASAAKTVTTTDEGTSGDAPDSRE